jgi:Xaa-Pro aminopeptidase
MDAITGISVGEYRDRQARLRAAAAERGLYAVVAVSRGGGTHDRTADALWLAGLAASQPFVPDLAGHWRGAGHVAVIVPVDGACTAIVESDELQTPPVADEVVVSSDVIAAAAAALADALGSGRTPRVGVLGSDVVPAAWFAVLEDVLRARGRLSACEPADDLAMRLRRIKSPAEQRLLRAAGALGSRAMDAALSVAEPGASEAQVAAAFFETVVAEGGAVYDVVVSSGPMSGTLGPSGGLAGAARWTTRTLHAGEFLRLDAYGSLGGYLFDFARSTVVGGDPSAEQTDLLSALRDAVAAGVELLRPGVGLSEVAKRCASVLAGSRHARRHGVPAHTMSGFWGHGLGLGWEPPWIGPDSPETVEDGMCLALERRAAVEGLGGAQYEDNVLVGANGPELLTRLPFGAAGGDGSFQREGGSGPF